MIVTPEPGHFEAYFKIAQSSCLSVTIILPHGVIGICSQSNYKPACFSHPGLIPSNIPGICSGPYCLSLSLINVGSVNEI